MKKVKLTRSEWLERNKALPIALIQKPLRFIRESTVSVEAEKTVDGKDTGRKIRVESAQYNFAREAADYGFGSVVKGIARNVLQGAI